MCNKLRFCHQGKVVNQVTGSYSHWASVQAQHPTGTGAHKDRVRANEFEKLLTRLHLSGLLQELVQLSGGDFFPNKSPTSFGWRILWYLAPWCRWVFWKKDEGLQGWYSGFSGFLLEDLQDAFFWTLKRIHQLKLQENHFSAFALFESWC